MIWFGGKLEGDRDVKMVTLSVCIRLYISQGFHDLFRDEEDRNVASDGAAKVLEKHDSRKPDMDGQESESMNKYDDLHITHGRKQRYV